MPFSPAVYPAFLLPLDARGASLRAGYVFADGDKAAQLYGKMGGNGGPRVVLDYLIESLAPGEVEAEVEEPEAATAAAVPDDDDDDASDE